MNFVQYMRYETSIDEFYQFSLCNRTFLIEWLKDTDIQRSGLNSLPDY